MPDLSGRRAVRRSCRVPTAVVSAGVLVFGATGAPIAAASSSQVAWGTTETAGYGHIGTLYSVAAASSGDAWAVGADNPDHSGSQVLDQPYAEHWNGTGWSADPVTAPSLYGTHQSAALSGVAAVGAGLAWAVGTVSDLWSIESRALAYQWSGQAWTRVPTPNPAGSSSSNSLLAVAVRSATSVWAAGYAGYPEASLLEKWNGTAWSTVTTPNIGALDAVAVSSASVWVASRNSETVEQYSTGAWHALPALPVTVGSPVSVQGLADTPAGLWAVGTTETPDNDGYLYGSYAALYNGSSWTRIPVPGLGLNGVAAGASGVVAAAQNNGVYQLTATGASRQVTPAPGTIYPVAVAADPSGNDWAVGFAGNGLGQAPSIIRAPGIGQGGIILTTGVSNATVSWTGPANGSGTTDVSGAFQVGGLPDGTYQVTAAYSGCSPATTTATVTTGIALQVAAPINCS